MSTLRNKTIIITGASRGIGREIALRVAKEGANVVVAAKTVNEDSPLPGTIHSVAAEVEQAGGKALALQVDVRDEKAVQSMVQMAAEKFGGIDALINNAGAISLTPTDQTPMKRYDLMHQVNGRAVYLCSQAAFPYLKKSENPHIINMSPPLDLDPKWFSGFLAYTLSKYEMTMTTIGLAAEWKVHGIAVNSLWPKRIIQTAATQMLFQTKELKQARKPAIMADAAFAILMTSSRQLTGQCLLDEDFLKSRGETNFEQYANSPEVEPLLDLFVSDHK